MRVAPTLEWRAVPSHIAEGPAEVRHVDGWLVCEVSADSYASLIAAAPDLLAALRIARAMVPKSDPELADFPLYQQIDAAIAKASRGGL